MPPTNAQNLVHITAIGFRLEQICGLKECLNTIIAHSYWQSQLILLYIWQSYHVITNVMSCFYTPRYYKKEKLSEETPVTDEWVKQHTTISWLVIVWILWYHTISVSFSLHVETSSVCTGIYTIWTNTCTHSHHTMVYSRQSTVNCNEYTEIYDSDTID